MAEWESYVRKVVPYTAGEQPKDRKFIKLNTNENPYPPAPGVQRALLEMADNTDALRLYPDMDATMLVDALAAFYGVQSDEIFVGVGSDDVLSMLFLTFFNSKDPILFPDITYSFYDVWADLYRIPYRQIPLDDNFEIIPEDYLPAVTGEKNGGVIFANPNAPTGAGMDISRVEQIIAGNPESIVIVDEAYIDFGAQSVLPLIHKYDNLIVVQTFSKSRSLAGMRIGYCFANPKLIKYLKDVKFSFNSYTMNMTAIRLGTEAVRDEAYFRETTGRIIETRTWFEKNLREMGFLFHPSGSNFVFAKHPKFTGDALFAALREQGVLVRHWNKPRIEDYLRITIGTQEDMEAVVEILKGIVSAC